MKTKSIFKSVLFLSLIFLVSATIAQVERDSDRRGGKRGNAVRDKDAVVEKIKSKIEKINKEMANYMVNDNINPMMNLYTTDAIILPNYDKKLSGKAAIKKDYEISSKKGIKFKDVKFTTQSIERAGNYIYEIGQYQMTMDIPGVPQKVTDIGKYLTIWEKNGKEFLVKVEMWNTDTNPMDKFMKGGGEKHDMPEKDK